MIKLRQSQLCAFGESIRARFIARMCKHLRGYFGYSLKDLDETSLEARVAESIERSAAYGLTSEQDCCRFLNLAVTYGWLFDEAPEHIWMKDYLSDPLVSSPSERLRRLVDRCIYQSEIEAKNRDLAEKFFQDS